jgi:hypothetical protein
VMSCDIATSQVSNGVVPRRGTAYVAGAPHVRLCDQSLIQPCQQISVAARAGIIFCSAGMLQPSKGMIQSLCRRSSPQCSRSCILLGCGSEIVALLNPRRMPCRRFTTRSLLYEPSLLYLAWFVGVRHRQSILLDLLPYSLDDFTSATSTSNPRGCRGRAAIATNSSGQPPVVAPRADSTSAFQSGLSPTATELLRTTSMLYQMTLTAGEAHEAFAFDAHTATGVVVYVQNEADCAYYDYTAVLPMPFPVTAGTRYWLQIRAREGAGELGIFWGWRVGSLDNGISATGICSRQHPHHQAHRLAFSSNLDACPASTGPALRAEANVPTSPGLASSCLGRPRTCQRAVGQYYCRC